MTAALEPKVRLGISACLLGDKVRYDGGHQRDAYLADVLGRYVDWVPVCPEVETGMGGPREPVRLAGDPERPRLAGCVSGEDWTDRMRTWAETWFATQAALPLCGFVFKSGSPSCGLDRIPVAGPEGLPTQTGPGLFARACQRLFPRLPMVDEDRLHDETVRDNFIEGIFACQRWLRLIQRPPSRAALRRFHARHRLQMISHTAEGEEALDRLAAALPRKDPEIALAAYRDGFLAALRRPATPRSRADALLRVLKELRTWLDWDEQKELRQAIQEYQTGLCPLLVPLTLARHDVQRYPAESLRGQTFLEPHPAELLLRNRV